MKNTKLYTVGISTILLVGGVLIFNQVVQQNSMGEHNKLSNTIEESELPTSTDIKIEDSLNEDDFSIEVVELDEDFILHFLIHNTSDEELVYGMHYSVSKLEKENWIPVELDMAFIEVACFLSANSVAEETIYLDYLENQLTSGTYRIEKVLSGVQYHDTFVIE